MKAAKTVTSAELDHKWTTNLDGVFMDPKGLKYLPSERDLEANDYEALDRRFWEGRDPNVPQQFARATFLEVLGQDSRVDHVLVSLRDDVLQTLLDRFGTHERFFAMAQRASAKARSLNLPPPPELTEEDLYEDYLVFGDDEDIDVEPNVATLDDDHTRTLTSRYELRCVGEALNVWAEQHNLRYPWVLRVASATVSGWWTSGTCDLRWNEETLRTLTNYATPSTGVFDYLLPSTQELRREPALESRKAYKARVNAQLDAYCDAQDRFDAEKNLRESGAYPELEMHLTWLALHLINGAKPKEVEKFVLEKEGEEGKLKDESTVRKGLKRAAEWCGIDLSRNPR